MSATVGTAAGEHLFWPVERWRPLQAERLASHLRHALKSPLYQNKNLERLEAGSLLTDALVAELPLTTKDQLAVAGADAWAVSPTDVAEWVCTSGTMGRPLDIPLTRSDLERLAENEAVALNIAGVGRGDLFVMAVGMDRMFVAGLAYWLGAQRLGATCVRVGPQVAAHPEMLSELLRRVDSRAQRRTLVIAVPSFLSGAAPVTSPLAGIIGIGEPTRIESLEPNGLAHRLGTHFGCPVMSTYATTETCTTFAEGPACKGGHLNPALAVLEVIDKDGNALPEGHVGEVVVTPLGMMGMPLLRFRTGDMAAMFTGPCPCGRTTPRVGPILGRRQQLLKIRGTSVFPSAIIEALRTMPEVRDCVVVAQEHAALGDDVSVFICATDESAATREKVAKRLQAIVRVTPPVQFVNEELLRGMQTSAMGRKIQRFIDHRAQGFGWAD